MEECDSRSGSLRDARQFSQGTVAQWARRKDGKINKSILLAFREWFKLLCYGSRSNKWLRWRDRHVRAYLLFGWWMQSFLAAAFTLATCTISISPPNSRWHTLPGLTPQKGTSNSSD